MPRIESPYVLDLEKYRGEQLARFEEGIRKAKDNLGNVYTGDKRVSDREYARRSRRFLRDNARRLYEMQLFPLPDVLKADWDGEAHEERVVIDKPLLRFRSTSATLFIDIDGSIFMQKSSIGNTTNALSTDTPGQDDLIKIFDEDYRIFAGDALDALNMHTKSHASEITPIRPAFRNGGLFVLPEDLEQERLANAEHPKDSLQAA